MLENNCNCLKVAPIGVFDSGFGGLTVMRALKTLLPQEHIFYFGDTAHLPYGEKSADLIMNYVLESARFLEQKGVKALILACHTASTVVGSWLAHHLSIPVIEITKPSIEEVLAKTKKQTVAILATRATLASSFYQDAISLRRPDITLHPIPCPLFVPFVEEGLARHPAADLIVQEYLAPLKNTSVDTLLLACTHYPLLMHFISACLSETVQLIDPSISCAVETSRVLATQNLLRTEPPLQDQFFVSGDPKKFIGIAPSFLGAPIPPSCVQRIAPV